MSTTYFKSEISFNIIDCVCAVLMVMTGVGNEFLPYRTESLSD